MDRIARAFGKFVGLLLLTIALASPAYADRANAVFYMVTNDEVHTDRESSPEAAARLSIKRFNASIGNPNIFYTYDHVVQVGPSTWTIYYLYTNAYAWRFNEGPYLYGSAAFKYYACDLSPQVGPNYASYAQGLPIEYQSSSHTCSTPPVVDVPKNMGCTDTCVSDPINPGIANQYLPEVDYAGAGGAELNFVRMYNSMGVDDTLLSPFRLNGERWRNSFESAISVSTDGTNTSALVGRPDGRILWFNLSAGSWVPDSDVSDTLTELVTGGVRTGWLYRTTDDATWVYDADGHLQSITSRSGIVQTLTYSDGSTSSSIAPVPGLLISVTNSFGHTLSFTYNADRHIQTMTDPQGGTFTYAYDGYDNLQSVTYPGGAVRTYLYGETAYTQSAWFPNHLTGITDENGQRFATYSYDSYGRAVATQHAGGAEGASLSYTLASGTARITSASVTDALSTARTHQFQAIQGRVKRSSISQPCGTGCTATQSNTHDTQGNLASHTDFNGNRTCYAYDLTRNLETTRLEGLASSLSCPSNLASYSPTSGTAERKISTTWDSTFRLPASITEAGRTTSFTYDSSGNELTRTITDTTVTPNVSRIWTRTYDSFGHVLTENGPRTDVTDTTTYAYYSTSATCTATVTGASTTGCRGQLQTVTNALSQVTTFNEYNAHGRVLKITNANSVVTTLAYDARQHLTSRQIGSETMTLTYWPTGLLKRVTLPDSSYVQYTYDNAHRLYKIEDGDGNRIEYTLDNESNRTAENAYDPSSALTRTHSRVFNALNQLWKDVNAAGTSAVTTVFGYDAQGNQTSIAAPLSRNTANQYDELNRLKQITDPASGVTQFGYDANDNLTSVSDPRTKVTSYTYNGFGDLTQQVSPDTGTTGDTYDSGGNLATSTDARSKTGTYSYDALNRVTSIAYTDLTTSFTYDSGTDGVGHLTGASDANHSLSWTYDAQGRVTGKSQTVGAITKSVSYGYTNGNLTSLTTPSGQTIAYGYSNGRIASVTLNGSTTILNQVLYEPFGPVAGWTWGNTTIAARVYDTDGKPSTLDSAGAYSYGYDDAFRITSIADVADSSKSWTYGYDALDRLNSASKTGQTIGYTYDANGNRLTQTGTQSATYTISSSNNRITSISGTPARSYSYDASGNTSGDGTLTFAYRDNGRMSSVTSGGVTTSYVMNALGQRVKKSNASLTRLFVYDEAGHLLGEYDATGALVQETVWMDDIPVATLRPNGASVALYYVHTDHLNTPRRISRPSDNAVLWRWESDPFGSTAANEDADGDSALFAYNLRFPGQYVDAESALNYNYARDYDSAIGRYIESDPLGLRGGLNGYAYAEGNPVSFADPTGLYCVFSQLAGSLRCTDDTTGQEYIKCNAYTGRGLGLNNPNYQWLSGDVPNSLSSYSHDIDAGPIPRGYYRVGAPINRRGFGKPVLPLDPLSFNSMYGRDAFQIHGDSRTDPGTASNGCIIADQKCRAAIRVGETLRVTW